MRNHRTRIPAILALVLFAAALAPAQENKPANGIVQSVDAEARTFTIKEHKTGEMIEISVPANRQVDVYADGKQEELQDGMPVKVYGKIAEDLAQIDQVRHVCLMPKLSQGTDKKSRLEGKYIEEGDKRFIEMEGQKIPMAMHDKWTVQKVYRTDFGFLDQGTEARHFRIFRKDDRWVAQYGVRVYADRDKTEAYIARQQ